MIGLVFIGQGQSQSRRDQWLAHLRQGERLARHKDKPRLHVRSDLTEDERWLLDDIGRQLDQCPRLSTKVCPECGDPFVRVRVRDIEVDACRRCKGIWFDPGELKCITDQSRDVPGDHLKARRSRYRCAVCGKDMTEFVFLRPFNLLVDRCPWGHGVYLEQGELERAFRIC